MLQIPAPVTRQFTTFKKQGTHHLFIRPAGRLPKGNSARPEQIFFGGLKKSSDQNKKVVNFTCTSQHLSTKCNPRLPEKKSYNWLKPLQRHALSLNRWLTDLPHRGSQSFLP